MGKVTPSRAIVLTNWCIITTSCWPVPVNASRMHVFLHKCHHVLALLNISTLFWPLMYSLYKRADDLDILVSTACIWSVVTAALCQIIVCMYHANRLQFVIAEMEKYCKRQEDYVQNILQNSVDTLLKYYGPFCFWAFFNAVIFISGPIFLPQDFPTHAEYPFSVESTLRKCVIFINQSVVTIQCIGHVNMNVFVAVLLWFTVARFEVLAFELSRTTGINEIIKCVKEHKILISYTEEVVRAVRFLILSELGSCSIRLIFSGLTLIRPQPTLVISQYMILNATALISVFICIWPADSLLDANDMIRRAAYNAVWYEIPNIRESMNIILLRCEKQLAVSASFILPAASLLYYRQFVSTAVSYFTVLRMVLEEEEAAASN